MPDRGSGTRGGGPALPTLSFAQDHARFIIFELYRSEDGRAAHQETAHLKAAIAALLPRVSSSERVPFVPYAEV